MNREPPQPKLFRALSMKYSVPNLSMPEALFLEIYLAIKTFVDFMESSLPQTNPLDTKQPPNPYTYSRRVRNAS